MSLFSSVRESKRVGETCCICGRPIPLLFVPEGTEESHLLLSFSDIETVNACRCGALYHVSCSAKRKGSLATQGLARRVSRLFLPLSGQLKVENRAGVSLMDRLIRNRACASE
jgi:hypothetical protein